MMKETLLAVVGSTLCLSTTFAAETAQPLNVNALIGLSAQDSDMAADGTAADADGNSDHETYLRINAGVNMITDTDIKGEPDKAQWNTGFGFDVAWGIPVAEDFAVEIGVGMIYNGLKGTKEGSVSLDIGGSLWQIPLMVNAVYDFHLTDSLTLGVRGGAGLQYNSFKFDQQTLLGTSIDQATRTSWTFRYQAGLDLTWALSETSSLGAYATFAWAPGIELDTETEFGTAQNIGLGVMYSFEF